MKPLTAKELKGHIKPRKALKMIDLALNRTGYARYIAIDGVGKVGLGAWIRRVLKNSR